MERQITIHIDENRAGTWRITASLSRPFLRGQKTVWRADKTQTAVLRHPYAPILTEALLTEWVTALTLVAAGFYEQPELEF